MEVAAAEVLRSNIFERRIESDLVGSTLIPVGVDFPVSKENDSLKRRIVKRRVVILRFIVIVIKLNLLKRAES